MMRRAISATALIIAVVLGLTLGGGAVLPARAEISPASYRTMQEEAGEHLIITVTKVTLQKKPQNATEVVAQATVKEVKKSATHLKAGDKITIRYDHTPLPEIPGFVGPAPIMIIKEGQEYPAFVTKEKQEYVPVARNYSFKLVK